MSDDEWCSMSSRYAKGEHVDVPGYSFTKFTVCPGCRRVMRLTWNGKFFRHKRALASRSPGVTERTEPT